MTDVIGQSTPVLPAVAEAPGPFHDLDAFIGLPRVAGLRLSPDGSRLVTAVSTLDHQRARYLTALWQVDPAGERPARRLTRSAKGESGAAFLPDGSLLFVSARPDPETKPDDDAPAALWLLPADGGEARVVATRAGGVAGVVAAAGANRIVVTSATLPGAVTDADDDHRRGTRKDLKVRAILHEGYPVRYWDHDLGPDQNRLLVADLPDEPASAESEMPGRVELRDLTPRPGRALDEATYDVSPDGATGQHRRLLDDPEVEYWQPRFSPDGRRVAVVAERRSTAQEPYRVGLVLLDLVDGTARPIAPQWDAWPMGAQWTPDGAALVVTADESGGSPVFRMDLPGEGACGPAIGPATDTVTRLTGDRGCYADLQVDPDGRHVYALRSSVDAAPAPVRLDLAAVDQQPVALRGPAPGQPLPGQLTEVRATAEDGVPLRAWLALPSGADPRSPAPPLLWIHGGPLGSWNSWSWRWNPWLMVARGYAVLLPDPALSTASAASSPTPACGPWSSSARPPTATTTGGAR